MDMNQAVAKAIAAERAIAGLTVRELSTRADIPLSTLMRILGAEREIKITQLEQLAAVFGITPVDIVLRAQEIRERAEVQPLPVVDEVDTEDLILAAKSREV
nr:MAG TPA: Regulatory protein [Caudoviricetes sp.]